LPWLALGWALYGLYLIFVVISDACGAPGATCRPRWPARGQHRGTDRARAAARHLGAGIALVIAYTAMLAMNPLLTRRLFEVTSSGGGSPRARRARRRVGGRRAGAATHGALGFILRALAWCLIWPLLRAVGFFRAASCGASRRSQIDICGPPPSA